MQSSALYSMAPSPAQARVGPAGVGLVSLVFGLTGRSRVIRGRQPESASPSPEVALSDTVETAAEIRPFTIDVPEEELADLRSRINATKWPDRETDASQGVQLETIQALASYWATDY